MELTSFLSDGCDDFPRRFRFMVGLASPHLGRRERGLYAVKSKHARQKHHPRATRNKGET